MRRRQLQVDTGEKFQEDIKAYAKAIRTGRAWHKSYNINKANVVGAD